MANELFKRLAIVKIGRSAVSQAELQGFRVAFQIGKTSSSTPDTSKIQVWNLSQSNRSILETNDDLIVSLEVGYGGFGSNPMLSQIFTGNVKRAKTERQGADIVTTIESGDAETALKEATINESFAPNTTSDIVISALAKSLNVAIGVITPGLTTVFENGLSLSGPTAKNLDILTKQAGLEWSVTDGELNILDPKLPTPDEAVLITKDTGLIGFPSKGLSGAIEFECLINPLLKPGRAVSLVSSSFSGVYKVRRCEYEGDTNQGNWNVKVEAIGG